MATERLVEDLLSLLRLVRRASHPVRRGEMTPEQYWLLRIVNRRGPISIGELAELLGITASSTTTACKRLEQMALLQRQRQSDDERVVLVALTPAGLARVEQWHQRQRELLAQLVAVLEPGEQDQMQQLLARILDAAGERGLAALPLRAGTREVQEFEGHEQNR